MAVLFSQAKGEYGKAKPFVSFALLLAWHFCFWFSPASITFAPLLDLGVTESWLAYLLASSCALLFAVAFLRSSRRLKATPRASLGCAAVLSAASLAFSFGLFSGSPAHSYGLPSLIGASEALCFILWGEFFSREDYDVSPLRAIGAASSVLFVAVGLFAFLPPIAAPIVAALLPLASAFLSSVDDGDGKDGLSPVLKPAPMRKDALKNIATVSAISLVAGFACFHLITIVPLDDLVGGEWVYYNGVLAGTLSIFFVSLVGARAHKGSPFKILSWLLVLVCVAFAVQLGVGRPANPFSFFMAASAYTAFELLLILYFAIIVQKGCATPAIAFGTSIALFRLGVLGGNVLSLWLESQSLQSSDIAHWAASLSLCAVIVLIVPLLNEGDFMNQLAAKRPVSPDDALLEACRATAVEFDLSKRELEVLTLLMKGYAIENIAEEFVISPYTVRAHVRHIYAKVGIHKRAELFSYVKEQIGEPSSS